MSHVVKGSKQLQMIVVPYRPHRRILFGVAILALLLISALGGWAFSKRDQADQDSALTVLADLTVELEAVRLENADLKKQVAILGRGSMMDQQANQEVQDTIRSLRNQVASLEQDIGYYRQVVAEETLETGLVVSAMDIDSTVEPDHFRYRLVLRQEDADGDTFLSGHVNVNLVGLQDNQTAIYPLKEVSEDVDQLDIRLRFRYFQNIEGELALPAGFSPDRIQIAAISVEPVEKTVNRNFNWNVRSN